MKDTGSRLWANHLNLSPMTVGSTSPVWILWQARLEETRMSHCQFWTSTWNCKVWPEKNHTYSAKTQDTLLKDRQSSLVSPHPIRILFICCVYFALTMKLNWAADQQSALSLVGSKVLVCSFPCLFLWLRPTMLKVWLFLATLYYEASKSSNYLYFHLLIYWESHVLCWEN